MLNIYAQPWRKSRSKLFCKIGPIFALPQFQSICFGYGFALMIGILVSGGVSGGHLNPGTIVDFKRGKLSKRTGVL